MSFLDDFRKEVAVIKDEYPYLAKWSDSHAMIMWAHLNEEQEAILKEFNSTVNPIKTGETISKEFRDDIEKVEYSKSKNPDNQEDTYDFIFVRFKNLENFTKVNDKLNAFGWYPSFIVQTGRSFSLDNIKKIDPAKSVTIKYEAKYDVELRLKEDYLYHVCPDFAYDNIQVSGLSPKSGSKIANHPQRIYLFVNENDDELKKISNKLYSHLKQRAKNLTRNYYFLKIAISDLKGRLSFYRDPNATDFSAVWTYGNIPPKYIEIVKKYDPDPNDEQKTEEE